MTSQYFEKKEVVAFSFSDGRGGIGIVASLMMLGTCCGVFGQLAGRIRNAEYGSPPRRNIYKLQAIAFYNALFYQNFIMRVARGSL